MRKFVTLSVLVVMLASVAAAQAAKPAASHPAFEQLKKLSGVWVVDFGKTAAPAEAVIVKFDVIANGSVLRETNGAGTPAEMITLYHLDGDTVVLDLDLGFYQWRIGRSYRLARINAPELSTPEGVAARAALTERLAAASAFLVVTAKADSFDRWIVELYADGVSVSDWLVGDGWAVYHTYR